MEEEVQVKMLLLVIQFLWIINDLQIPFNL